MSIQRKYILSGADGCYGEPFGPIEAYEDRVITFSDDCTLILMRFVGSVIIKGVLTEYVLMGTRYKDQTLQDIRVKDVSTISLLRIFPDSEEQLEQSGLKGNAEYIGVGTCRCSST